MNKKVKYDYKHLTLSQRITIEKGLDNQESFAAIARRIGKDPSTVSKEVKRHLSYTRKQDVGRAIPCANRAGCHNYKETECSKLIKAPYVCNGCGDINILDTLISPLLKKGQSLAHIYAHHAAEIPCSRKTLYNYIDKGVFTARNLDMRRRVRYKVRKKPTQVSLSVRKFRQGRSYEEFQKRSKDNPNLSVVEMDTVIGKREGILFS